MHDQQPHYGPPPYGPPPGYGPTRRSRSISGRPIAVVFGIVALAGVLCTLLPLWTITLNPDDYRGYGVSDVDDEFAGSVITLNVGFYDWLTSSALVLALIPMALAVAVGVAVIQVVRAVPDRNLWGASAAFASCTLVLVASVAVSPSSTLEVTGQLSRELNPRDLTVNQASSLNAEYGPGLIIAVVALVVVGGLAAWQYVATPSTEEAASQ